MSIRVVTDSSCDLPQNLVDAHRIEIVPLTIRFGNEEFVDREELSTDEFWHRLETTKELPSTAAPSAGAFEQRFRFSQHDVIGKTDADLFPPDMAREFAAEDRSVMESGQSMCAESRALRNGAEKWIEVIKVPLGTPGEAAIVSSPRGACLVCRGGHFRHADFQHTNLAHHRFATAIQFVEALLEHLIKIQRGLKPVYTNVPSALPLPV